MDHHPVPWIGINHLALITNDMDMTTRFWHGVLGAPLVATIGNESFRHYFFDVGSGSTVAFFEYRDHHVDLFSKPAGVPDERAVQFDHVALNLPDEAALLSLRQRLQDCNCEVTEVVDHGLLRSIYFTDPNGIALEASWWVDNPTGQQPASGAQRYSDADPVPAVQELLHTGTVSQPPATGLVDQPTGDMYHFIRN
jgi:catechol 2,3-dioxygenase-like lactoylglutathione lyase family enzyme